MGPNALKVRKAGGPERRQVIRGCPGRPGGAQEAQPQRITTPGQVRAITARPKG